MFIIRSQIITLTMILLNKYTFPILFLLVLWGCTKEEPSEIQKDVFIKNFGGAFNNEAIDILSNNENYYLLGNEKDEDGQSSIVFIKTDLFGNRVWEKSYYIKNRQTKASQLIKLEQQDGFAIIGSIEMDDDSLFYDSYLLILDNNGGVILEKTYDFSHSEFGKCIAELDNGGFIIAISQDTLNGSSSHMSLFVRLYSNGLIVPLSSSEIPGSDLFQIYKNNNNKGFYITGQDNTTPEIIIINPDGTMLGSLKLSSIDGKIFSITQDISENTFICGELNNGANGGKDGFIAQLDKIGESIDYKWIKEFGNNKNDKFNHILITNDNKILTTGSIENDLAISDIWTLKTDINGQLISESIIGGDDQEYGVKVIEQNNNKFIVMGTKYFESSSFISIFKSEFK